MGKTKGLIFDIQSYSVHDGPGCRTSVFMMSCPLRCLWCANPEGQSYSKRLLYRKSRCILCGKCIISCPYGAIVYGDGEIKIDWTVCSKCSDLNCVKECFSESLSVCGRDISADELMKILNRDRNYWGNNGGVTFTGGEPLVQNDFLISVLKRCKEAYIHTAIETGCYGETEKFLEVMKYIDFAFVDIKVMDRLKHRKYTGADNDLILKNIRTLSEEWQGRLIVRIPIIEGVNDDEENIIKTADFMNTSGLKEVNILSFNPLGESKWKQCGMNYKFSHLKPTSEKTLMDIENIFIKRGIICYIDSNTPW